MGCLYFQVKPLSFFFTSLVVPQPVYMNASELRASSGQPADPEGGNGIYSSLGSCTGLEGHFFDDGQGKGFPLSATLMCVVNLLSLRDVLWSS